MKLRMGGRDQEQSVSVDEIDKRSRPRSPAFPRIRALANPFGSYPGRNIQLSTV